MKTHKLPSQLTEEELLELLASEDTPEATVEIFNYEHDIVPFMGFYKITPGDTPVSKKLLYKLYKAYSKEPLDKLRFNIQLGQYVTARGYHFLLNLDNFAISNHIYKEEKTRDKTKNTLFQKHFDWFISTAPVQKGSSWVEGFIIFQIYKDFCRERRVNPKLGYVNFHKFLKLNFQSRRIKENRSLWFKVNYDIANKYTEEEKNVIRESRQETRGSQKKKQRKAENNPPG